MKELLVRNLAFIFLLTTTLIFQSCNFSENDGEGAPGSGLVSGHKEVENQFTLNVSNGVYSQGSNLQLTLNFPFDVNVAGSPRLAIDIGGSNEFADYLSGDGTSSLIFQYTVQAGDTDLDGISVNGLIDLNGGTLQFDLAGVATDCNLNLSLVSTSNVRVDAINPTLTAFNKPVDGLYPFNFPVLFTVDFSEAVYVSGTPRLQLDVGGSTVYANYISGTGTSTLVFNHVVDGTDFDLDGISVTSPIDLNGGSIKDSGDNDASISFIPPSLANVFLNGDSPTVVSMNLPADSTYALSQDLDIVLNFSEVVNVTGTPRIELNLDSGNVYANYQSGSGTNALTFRYTVGVADLDLDGFTTSPLIDLNGGSISDANPLGAILGFIPSSSNNLFVDGRIPAISSITPPADNTYNVSQFLNFTVTYDQVVNVTGNPSLTIDIGGVTRSATYLAGSGSTDLIFAYQVVAGDNDNNGIELNSPLVLNGGTIQNAASINAGLVFTPPTMSAVLVSSGGANITSINPPSDSTYIKNQNMDFIINWSDTITVTGTPRLRIDLETGGPVYADYLSGSGTNALTFRYTVEVSKEDLNGITLVTPLELNSGTLIDSNTDNATLGFTAPNTNNVLINSMPAQITSITPPADNTYIIGQDLDFVVNWDANVTISGTPRIRINLETGGPIYADYLSGSGTNAITFRHTLTSGKEDINGIEMVSPIDLNSGTIIDANTDNAILTFTSPDTSSVLVNTMATSITSITAPADDTYFLNDDLDFVVNWSDTVTVTGTPRIQIDLAIGGPVYADYLSGSGTNTLTFRYTVAAAKEDLDGIVLVSPMDLNSGTILDSNTDAVALNFTAPSTNNVFVNSSPTNITSITPPADNTYLETDNMDFVVNFSANVNVTGTPRLQIDLTSGGTVYADYQSGTGTNALTFRYIVENAKEDLDGITLVSPLDPNGGTIQDLVPSAVLLTFTPPNTSAVLVDSLAPTITSVDVPANDTYIESETLDFVINFSEPVTLTGADSYVDITIDATSRQALCTPATSATINCSYTVLAGEDDSDGIVHTSPIQVGTSTFQDAQGLTADLTFTPASTSSILVDTTAPTITSITAPSDGDYKESDTLDFIVNFSEAVNVTSGTPQIQLDVGGSIAYADYLSGSGSNALTFRYTVAALENDSDGITEQNNLVMTGATIEDLPGNTADVSFTGSNYPNVIIDTTAPAMPIVTSTTPTSFSQNTAPDVNGTGEANITVKTFSDASCSTELASGSVDGGGSFALSSSVPTNVTTSLYAKLIDDAGNESACSTTFVSYEQYTIASGFLTLTGTQTTNSTNFNQATAYAIEWDNGHWDQATYSHDNSSNSHQVTVVSGGDYLISVNLPLSSTVQRANIQMEVFINGSFVDGSISQSAYIRGSSYGSSGSDHLSMLLEGLSANDIVEVRAKMIAASGTVTIYENATLVMEKVNSSRDIFTATTVETINGTNFNQTSSVKWLESIKDSEFSHDNVTNPDRISVTTGGDYLVKINIPLESTSSRSNVRADLKVNGALVPGGVASQGYIRTSGGHNESSLHMFIVAKGLSANDYFTVDVSQEGSNGTVNILAGQKGSIYVERIDTASNVYSARATELVSGTNWNSTTKSNIEWAIDDIIDSSTFLHNTSVQSHEITVKSEGDYLFVFNHSVTSSSTRPVNRITFEVNGVEQDGATCQSTYIRNSSGHNESSCSMVFYSRNLQVNDVITLSSGQTASGGTVDDVTDAAITIIHKP